MISLKQLDREYIKTNREIDKIEIELQDLKDHKVRLKYFYETYYKNKPITKKINEVLKHE